jgi:hypothetical protein
MRDCCHEREAVRLAPDEDVGVERRKIGRSWIADLPHNDIRPLRVQRYAKIGGDVFIQ